ncbi:MAG: NUDIX hydrolase [Pseudomonadota bacterium]
MNDNIDDDGTLVPAIPAATLVLFREREDAPPEVLVVERSAKMAFAGGAIVFPGGRIDDDDHAIAADIRYFANDHALEIEEAAARIAAIRETLEESGIAIGFATPPAQDWIETAQARLHARELFSLLLDEAQATLDLDSLIPFARWRPNFREARAFDTRFYIARVPADTPEPVVDQTENVLSFWASAADLLTAADTGKVKVIFPTRRNLERLALFGDFASAETHARAIPVEIICPYFEERDGERYLCIPTHLGYPVTAEIMTTALRGGR